MPEHKKNLNAAAEAHEDINGQTVDQYDDDASTVDSLVSALQAHVRAADDRHGDLLANMRDRLGNLDGNVDDIRHRIPEDLGGKLEGIETGLENLNQRVAQIWAAEGSLGAAIDLAQATTEPSEESEAPTEFKFAEFDPPEAEHAEDALHMDAGDDQNDVADFGEDTGRAYEADRDDEPVSSFAELGESSQSMPDAPAALKSASHNEVSGTHHSENTSAHLMHGIDTFDMVDTSVPGDPGSPWDHDSAEALTKLYETPYADAAQDEVQVMPARTPDPEMEPSEKVQEAAPDSYETAPAGSSIDETDRAWLEGKFTEIAERIEQTLAELDPKKTVAEFDHRMQSMEHRVDTALQDVAMRSDLEGLRDLETHVSGMAATMAHTETQMQRLDSIEGTLHEIVTRFTEGSAAQFADMDGMGGAGVDPDQVAEAAAARIADHLAATGQDGNSSAITDVRDMIEGFLNEHREGNEQTNLMLDTIQQAMIRILDRLDVLEAAGGFSHAAPQDIEPEHGYVEDAPTHHADPVIDEVAAAQGWAEPITGHGSDDDIELTDPASYEPVSEEEAVVEIHAREDEETHILARDEAPTDADQLAGSTVAAASAVAQQALSGSTAPEAKAATMRQASPDLLSDRTDSVVVPAESGATSRDTIEKIRHNFIADAQQAKARAAQAAAQSAVAEPKQSGRTSVLSGIKPSKKESGESGGFFGTKTRRLLIGALLAVAAIQGALIFMPGRNDAMPEAVAPAGKAQSIEKQSQSGKPAKLEKSSFLSPGDGFSPSIEGGVLVDDVQKAAIDAEHRQAGSADLPFGLMLQQTTAKEWTGQGRPIFESKTAAATQVALKPEEKIGGGRVYKVPVSSSSGARAKLPPLSVGPMSLRMAAAKGDPSAQFEVGTRLSEGKGTKQNFKEASVWFKRSAAQGFAQAQYRLGTLYERGLGVGRDVNKAQVWYLRAAEQGNIRAMHNLAVLSAGQASGKPDYDRAAQWFIKAADNGLADSQFNAGVLFENGLGVSKDMIQAYKWYTLAARNGDQESLKRSQKLRSKLSIEELGEAETAVRGFTPGKVDPMVNNARLAGQDWKSRHNS